MYQLDVFTDAVEEHLDLSLGDTAKAEIRETGEAREAERRRGLDLKTLLEYAGGPSGRIFEDFKRTAAQQRAIMDAVSGPSRRIFEDFRRTEAQQRAIMDAATWSWPTFRIPGISAAQRRVLMDASGRSPRRRTTQDEEQPEDPADDEDPGDATNDEAEPDEPADPEPVST